MQNSNILREHIRRLSFFYPVAADDALRFIVVRSFRLPSGYSTSSTSVLLSIPEDYPLSPPGLRNAKIYIPADLRYCGQELKDVHEDVTPEWGNWSWFCYERICWNPKRDDLLVILELVRMNLTDPPTR